METIQDPETSWASEWEYPGSHAQETAGGKRV